MIVAPRLLVAAGLALALSACAPQVETAAAPPAEPPALSRSTGGPAEKVAAPVRLAVVGDSISAWSPPFAGDPAQSWVFAATSNDVPLVGGWALPGATIGQMRAAVQPADDVDVLVLMLGTNDVYQGSDVAQRLADIDAIVATINARRVIVCSVAPFGYDIALGEQWSATLAAHAAARGWAHVDPWAEFRQSDGRWTLGADYGDAVHPSPATAARVGEVLRDVIVEAARPSSSRP